MYGFDHREWMPGGGGIATLLWWAAACCAVVAFYLFRQPGQGERETNALDILKGRYARGEIGKDEFE